MVWVILGPLGPFIGEAYKLSASQKGFLTAVPLLGGSFFRLVLGWATERFGARRTALTGLALTLLPLMAAWRFANSYGNFLAIGALLGIAGASFAAALPLASGWYPPEHQGLAMGIAGAGNSGTLLATLFAPRLAEALGWRNVFALVAIPVVLVWTLFFFMAKDGPAPRVRKKWSDYGALFKIGDTGWFCFLYSLTFGGFSGFASYLSIFFRDQYHVSKIEAGDLTTFVVLFGSFLRPAGGLLADRIGGYRTLLVFFSTAVLSLVTIATLPETSIAVGFFALLMAMLGMGNGAIFQLVPQRFAGRVGIMTGVVGAAGGFGGFLLPSLLGVLKDRTATFSTGFIVIAALFLGGFAALLYLRNVWRRTWPTEAAERAGLGACVTVAAEVYAAD
jgi:NNP family nitrate/nitrite transporter-like MFS transporter